MQILAIDIGGTKSAIGLCKVDRGENTLQVQEISGYTKFSSRSYQSLETMIEDWTTKFPEARFECIGAGVAGPVQNQCVHLTNLGWNIDGPKLSQHFKKPFNLCNDMESHGWGILGLSHLDVHPLQRGLPGPGAKALIAAGTGLGESVIGWNGQTHCPMPGEGGHSSFSPADDRDDQLLKFLRNKMDGHVSWERVLGGYDGFRHLTAFLSTYQNKSLPPYILELSSAEQDWGAATARAASSNDPFAQDVMTWYCTLYGREAANLALKCVPQGGVYLGGGIAKHIQPWLSSHFLTGFLDKGRFATILKTIPVYIILDELNGLKGAALQYNSRSS